MENVEPNSLDEEARLGLNLKNWRVLRGLTQEVITSEMVKRGFDFHQSTLYKIENGKRRVLLSEGIALSEILGISIGSLAAPESNPEETLLAQIKVAARRDLESIASTLANLDAARMHRVLGVQLNIKKLETQFGRDTVYSFGDVSATARDFYAPLIEAEDQLQKNRDSLAEILKNSESVSSYLNL